MVEAAKGTGTDIPQGEVRVEKETHRSKAFSFYLQPIWLSNMITKLPSHLSATRLMVDW